MKSKAKNIEKLIVVVVAVVAYIVSISKRRNSIERRRKNKRFFETPIGEGKSHNFIVVFLHNVKYNEERIYLAIQIIDMLYPIVQQNANMEHESISSEQLNAINKEFQEMDIKQG